MASSKVMASRSPPNQDPPPENPTPSLNLMSGNTRASASVCMDDLLLNMYSDSDAFVLGRNGAATGGGVRNGSVGKAADEECWDTLRVGGSGGGKPLLTLNDLLVTAGVMIDEDARIPVALTVAPPTAPFGMDGPLMSPAAGAPAVQYAPGAAVCLQNGYGVDFANGVAAPPSSGRGKRRAVVEDAPMDKATQQKQRRMIKNRESAARSRERKQAHTVELESLVAQLEEDNARLLRQGAEMKRERYKQLMETVIPITERQKPPTVLHRRNSMTW